MLDHGRYDEGGTAGLQPHVKRATQISETGKSHTFGLRGRLPHTPLNGGDPLLTIRQQRTEQRTVSLQVTPR